MGGTGQNCAKKRNWAKQNVKQNKGKGIDVKIENRNYLGRTWQNCGATLAKTGQNWTKLGETRRRLKLDEIGRKLSKIDENWVKVNWRKLEKTRQNWAKLGETGRNWMKLEEKLSKTNENWVKLRKIG